MKNLFCLFFDVSSRYHFAVLAKNLYARLVIYIPPYIKYRANEKQVFNIQRDRSLYFLEFCWLFPNVLVTHTGDKRDIRKANRPFFPGYQRSKSHASVKPRRKRRQNVLHSITDALDRFQRLLEPIEDTR